MGMGSQEEKHDGEEVTEENKNLLPVEVATVTSGRRSEDEDGPPPPPDGGWGWVVVAASFLCNMVLDGIGYSFGILLVPLMNHYNAGKGTISMVGSILAGVIMLVGPISSILVNKLGPRLTCISGAVVSAVAIFVSTFSVNVYMLMAFYGVFGGLGLGLMYVPAVTAVGYWFEKKRSLVTGISTCGSGFGTIVFAPVVTALESNLGWQWCNRIVAGFCLLCTLLGMTMKPVPRKAKDEEDSITELKKQTEERPIIKQQEAPDTCCATKEAPKEEAKEAAKENGYLTVIKNVPFLCVMLANLPAVMGLYIPYMFLPGITQQRGLSEADSALLISLIGFFNTGGRIVSGAITDHPRVDALFLTTLAIFSGAICPALMTLCYDFWSYSIVCVMFGLFLSAWPAVTSSCLVDILGLEHLTSAFGVLTCIRGLSAFLGPPLGGFVIDATSPEKPPVEEGVDQEDTSNYEVAFYISACLLGAASVGHMFAYIVKRTSQRRREAAGEAAVST